MQRVKDIMTRRVEIASPDDTLREIAAKMAQLDCGVLPVGENDRLVGMITDRDIVLRAVAKGLDPQKTKAREIMSPGIKYCFEDDTVDEVAENMKLLQIKRLPVVTRAKRLCGIVSLGDLAVEDECAGQAIEALAGISMPDGQGSEAHPRH